MRGKPRPVEKGMADMLVFRSGQGRGQKRVWNGQAQVQTPHTTKNSENSRRYNQMGVNFRNFGYILQGCPLFSEIQ